MAWRGLHITQPARLRLTKGRVEVAQGETTLDFPLEDVAWIVLDTGEATLSARLIATCMESGTPIIFTDARHMPCGVALPFHQHFRQAEVAHRQIALGAPLRKRLWRAMVRAKITNQGANLDRAQAEGGSTIRAMARHVRPGDPDNVEARAARYYWPRLFDDFRRGEGGDHRNALLDYGYAVLRAALARGLVASGLLPAFGVHHRSVQNAFNLADDLIEPFRPAVDWLAFERCHSLRDEKELSREDRQWMAGVLSENVVLDGGQLSVLSATERAAASLARAIGEGDGDVLQLPIT